MNPVPRAPGPVPQVSDSFRMERMQRMFDRYGKKGKLDSASPEGPGDKVVAATVGSGS